VTLSRCLLEEVSRLSFSSDDFAKALEQHDYAFQKGQIVRGKAYSYESDGAYVDIGGKSAAFLPLEEASLRRISDVSEVLPLQEELEFLIVREQDADGQVTLSLRQLELRQIWAQFAEMQEENKTIQVRVNGFNKGGVTVDAMGLRGFIPRSHLSERENLESLIGKSMTVAFIEVNPTTKKLVLSQRLAAQAASFGQIAEGQLISGKVSGIKPFGVFVDFDGATGLLHINQISKNYVSSLGNLFELGQPIRALVNEVDEVKRRISLSTKPLENYPGEMLENMAAVMAEAEARAQKLQKSAEQTIAKPVANAGIEPAVAEDADESEASDDPAEA
jgi:small subunit ribosomal protein S1